MLEVKITEHEQGREWVEYCGAHERGNEIMHRIAVARFAADPSIDVVTVREHAGWSLSWNRNGDCVGTANDAAILPQSVRQWRSQFSGFDHVGYTRRDDCDASG